MDGISTLVSASGITVPGEQWLAGLASVPADSVCVISPRHIRRTIPHQRSVRVRYSRVSLRTGASFHPIIIVVDPTCTGARALALEPQPYAYSRVELTTGWGTAALRANSAFHGWCLGRVHRWMLLDLAQREGDWLRGHG